MVAWWGYELLRIAPEIDRLVRAFYHDTVGPYWAPERAHIAQRYQSLEFPYAEIAAPDVSITTEWTPTQLAGYLGSWSATQSYIASSGRNPVLDLMSSILPLWPRAVSKPVEFPMFVRVGRK